MVEKRKQGKNLCPFEWSPEGKPPQCVQCDVLAPEVYNELGQVVYDLDGWYLHSPGLPGLSCGCHGEGS